MPDKRIELIPENDGGGAVVLPYDLNELGKFIAGLLGKPQTITKNLFLPFEITKDSIRNIDALLGQRIFSQNKGVLAQFVAQTSYDDDTSVVINSLSDFLSYHEARPVVVREAAITWAFLIQFEGRSTPEKETVELKFFTRRSIRPPAITKLFEDHDPKPKIEITISHTNRTWGEDIEALLVKSLAQYNRKAHWSRRFLNGKANAIFFLTFAGVLFGGYVISEAIKKIEHERLQEQIQSLASAIDYLRFIVDHQVNANSPADASLSIVSGVSFFGSFAVSTLFYLVAASERPSFINFTEQGQRQKEASDRSLKHTWGQVLMAAVLSLLIGLFGKYLYDLIAAL
jgi:hypothetical protein